MITNLFVTTALITGLGVGGGIAPDPAPVFPELETGSIIEIMEDYRIQQDQEFIRLVNDAQLPELRDSEDSYLSIPAELRDESAIVLPVDDAELSSDYGPRNKSCEACSSFHKGVDFTPGYGAPVYAITSGVVTNIGFNSAGYGRYIYLEHNIDGEVYVTVYAHLEQWTVAVEEGDTVAPGQQIGTVGNTGISTGPHLHFEVRDSQDNFLDPEEFFASYLIDLRLF